MPYVSSSAGVFELKPDLPAPARPGGVALAPPTAQMLVMEQRGTSDRRRSKLVVVPVMRDDRWTDGID